MLTPHTKSELDNFLVKLHFLTIELRQDNFCIGIDTYTTLHNLLLNLASQGQLNTDFGRLRTLIAPLLCSTKEEQEIFYCKFDKLFLTLNDKNQDNINTTKIYEYSDSSPKKPLFNQKIDIPESNAENNNILKIFLMSVIGLLLLGLSSYLGDLNQSVSLSEKPIDRVSVSANQPSSNNNPLSESSGQDQDKTKSVLIILLLILFIILIWLLKKYIKIQFFLKKHGALHPPDLGHCFLENQSQLHDSQQFFQISQHMHMHYALNENILDIEKTIQRTSQACGFYVPAYTALKAVPEYLVLIDRLSFNDNLSQFVDTLFGQLEYRGLFINIYYFDEDPRFLYSKNNPEKHCSIEYLKNHIDNHRLAIFSDIRNFFHPISGQPYPWLHHFQEWQNIYLFTLDLTDYYDYYALNLSELGFVVLPTGLNGLSQFVDSIINENKFIYKNKYSKNYFPSLLVKHPWRFLERHTPDPYELDELFLQLNTYLGDDGFKWLAACAVYPELIWHLTLYLGREGFIRRSEKQLDVNESLLLRLLQLPWLRYAYMPDWLRKEILLKLLTENETNAASIRDSFQSILLKSSLISDPSDANLSFAREAIRDILLVWQSNTDRYHPINDYIFHSFTSNRLTKDIPDNLNRILIKVGSEAKIYITSVLLSIILVLLTDIELNKRLSFIEELIISQEILQENPIQPTNDEIDRIQKELSELRKLVGPSIKQGENGILESKIEPINQAAVAKIIDLENQLATLKQKQQHLTSRP